VWEKSPGQKLRLSVRGKGSFASKGNGKDCMGLVFLMGGADEEGQVRRKLGFCGRKFHGSQKKGRGKKKGFTIEEMESIQGGKKTGKVKANLII